MSANKRLAAGRAARRARFEGVLVSDYAGITEMRNHGTSPTTSTPRSRRCATAP
jgi:hypothetical protein